MPYEVTCPSCHVRLSVQDDAAAAALICPRCLRTVPHPAAARQAPAAAGESTAITAGPPTAPRATPSVESESRRSIWSSYWASLALVLLGGFGLILAVRSGTGMGVWVVPVALFCDAALTALIVFPPVYALVRKTRPAAGATATYYAMNRVIVILLLVILVPIAVFIVFFTICFAGVAVTLR
jgi:hypothetical protein